MTTFDWLIKQNLKLLMKLMSWMQAIIILDKALIAYKLNEIVVKILNVKSTIPLKIIKISGSNEIFSSSWTRVLV